MKTFLLLVTWILSGQINSYQVVFDSAETCAAARSALFQEQARFKAEVERNAADAATVRQKQGIPAGPMTISFPIVTAICVAK